jgi:hypothetical protein
MNELDIGASARESALDLNYYVSFLCAGVREFQPTPKSTEKESLRYRPYPA